MRTRIIFIALISLAAPLFLATANAAATLDELLQQTRNSREEEDQNAALNAEKFNNASEADQARMLRETTAERDARAAVAKSSADAYSENEIRINGRNAQLRRKASELGVGEVFGLARQVSADVVAVLQQSMITAQFVNQSSQEDRVTFL